jgi:hypothetical protein
LEKIGLSELYKLSHGIVGKASRFTSSIGENLASIVLGPEGKAGRLTYHGFASSNPERLSDHLGAPRAESHEGGAKRLTVDLHCERKILMKLAAFVFLSTVACAMAQAESWQIQSSNSGI